MKSQVNALLHVASGIIEDARKTYPALEGSLLKDLSRLTLYCQTRDLAVFTLDLPELEARLLRALETGFLVVENAPFSKLISRQTKVPRLFGGLWLKLFDRDACLKHEVDVNALFFLLSLLGVGKKLEVDCSDDRKQAKVGEYHDIERKLRHPSFSWNNDEFRLARGNGGDLLEGSLHSRNRHHCGGAMLHYDLFLRPVSENSSEQVEELGSEVASSEVGRSRNDLQSVHLAQAVDYVHNSRLRPTDLFREGYSKVEQDSLMADIRLLSKIQSVADLIFSSFGPFDPIEYSTWLEERGLGTGFKHGKGAVAERKKNHEKSDFDSWPSKLERVFPWEFCGKSAGSDKERPVSHEVPGRLLCVPKTAKGPRLITSESTAHMWCQQLIWNWFKRKCKEQFGEQLLDFSRQDLSGDMTLRASLDKSLATIDLSDASDRLSCWTVERMFRTNESVLLALHAARTRFVRDEVSDDKSFLSLRKFAAQGTAATFPVMSLVMLCIALGSTMGDTDRVTWSRLRELAANVRVFGDDIIVPSHGYERVLRAMELLELKVNTAKSYVNGHFREACGTWAYMGYNVTPVRPKTVIADSPASCQAVVDTSNNLFNKGLWYASRTADDLLPISIRKYLRIVGRNEAGRSGLTSFVGGYEHHLVKRWNSRLHRDEVRVWTTKVRAQRQDRDGFDALLDFFTRVHSASNPRVVSEYVDRRRTISRLSWEPQSPHARVSDSVRRVANGKPPIRRSR